MRNRTPFLFTGKERLFLCAIVVTAMLGMMPGNAGRRAYAHETPDRALSISQCSWMKSRFPEEHSLCTG